MLKLSKILKEPYYCAIQSTLYICRFDDLRKVDVQSVLNGTQYSAISFTIRVYPLPNIMIYK